MAIVIYFHNIYNMISIFISPHLFSSLNIQGQIQEFYVQKSVKHNDSFFL